ncbi:MAG: EamA family transporter, partial [Deltaproteobacteria bacterium]|nr:EamA family transporter [Deltaproteobacteria bacterium]
AAVMWASSGTAGKALFAVGMTPFALVQIRVTLSAALLAITFLLGFRQLFRIRRADIGYFLLLGGVAMAMVQITYFFAISKIQVAAAIFLQYLSPLIVTLFSVCFWKERLTPAKMLALGLSIMGSYLVVGGYSMQLLRMNGLGILSGLTSALFFAAYTLIGERGMHRYPPWTVIFYAFLFAALTWHVIYPPFHYLRAGYDLRTWIPLVYISVAGTLIPFGLFFMAVNYIRSTRASITATLEPIAAGGMAYLFLGETLGWLQMVGGTMVIGAIVLLQIQREHEQLAPQHLRSQAKSIS